MTDNEIIKASEWCEHFENNIVLSGRSGEKFTLALQAMQTVRRVIKDYSRQKAELENQNLEIDILIRKKESLRDEIAELTAAVERLEEERDAMHRDVITAEEYAWNLNEKLKIAKSEAIREFVNEYKDHINSFTGMFSPELGFTVSLDAVLYAVDFISEKILGRNDEQ